MSKTFKNKWFEFTTGFSKLAFKISPAAYFDTRAMIYIAPGWGQFFIKLPIRSNIYACEYPSYGFYFYSTGSWFPDSLWFCWGMKIKSIRMPWTWDWVRTSYLKKDGSWAHRTNENRKEFDLYEAESKLRDELFTESYSYTYVLKDGTVQNRTATVKVEEREWRWKWFKWLGFPKKVHRDIDVRFDAEVGEKTGSWKGGCMGWNWRIKNNETPLECLRRAEKEREFN